jgi:hypothetical protein
MFNPCAQLILSQDEISAVNRTSNGIKRIIIAGLLGKFYGDWIAFPWKIKVPSAAKKSCGKRWRGQRESFSCGRTIKIQRTITEIFRKRRCEREKYSCDRKLKTTRKDTNILRKRIGEPKTICGRTLKTTKIAKKTQNKRRGQGKSFCDRTLITASAPTKT